MHELLYVFGGLNGETGTSIPNNPAQQFFSINLLNNYAVTPLSVSGVNFPVNVWINPTLFTEATENYLYLYSGMYQDGLTWNSPFNVYIYSLQANAWLPPVEPNLSPYTSLPNQLPNIVFAGHAMTLDDQHLILVGGNEGPHTPNVAGTHNKIVHIDATPMNGNATTASPLISVIPARLLQPIQSPVVALEVSDTEIVVFGGATYPNTWASFPQTYVNLVQEVTLLNHQNVVGGSSSSSSSSSLSSGDKAAIALGVILAVVLIGILAYVLCFRKGKTASYGEHSNGRANDMEMGSGRPAKLQEDS